MAKEYGVCNDCNGYIHHFRVSLYNLKCISYVIYSYAILISITNYTNLFYWKKRQTKLVLIDAVRGFFYHFIPYSIIRCGWKPAKCTPCIDLSFPIHIPMAFEELTFNTCITNTLDLTAGAVHA